MPKSHSPYPPEYRQHTVELVRSGRTPEDLAREFEPTAQCIRDWVKAAERQDGTRADGLTQAEHEELKRLRREVKILRQEKEILKKSRSLVRAGEHTPPSRIFRFIVANQAEFSVSLMCRVLGVSWSGYYAWRTRRPLARSQSDAVLQKRIGTIHEESYGIYGRPRIPCQSPLRRRVREWKTRRTAHASDNHRRGESSQTVLSSRRSKGTSTST